MVSNCKSQRKNLPGSHVPYFLQGVSENKSFFLIPNPNLGRAMLTPPFKTSSLPFYNRQGESKFFAKTFSTNMQQAAQKPELQLEGLCYCTHTSNSMSNVRISVWQALSGVINTLSSAFSTVYIEKGQQSLAKPGRRGPSPRVRPLWPHKHIQLHDTNNVCSVTYG